MPQDSYPRKSLPRLSSPQTSPRLSSTPRASKRGEPRSAPAITVSAALPDAPWEEKLLLYVDSSRVPDPQSDDEHGMKLRGCWPVPTDGLGSWRAEGPVILAWDIGPPPRPGRSRLKGQGPQLLQPALRFPTTGAVTIAIWAKWGEGSPPGAPPAPVLRFSGGYMLSLDEDGLAIGSGTDSEDLGWPRLPVPRDMWALLFLVIPAMDGETCDVYCASDADGLRSIGALAAPPPGAELRGLGGGAFVGFVAELACWSRELTQSERYERFVARRDRYRISLSIGSIVPIKGGEREDEHQYELAQLLRTVTRCVARLRQTKDVESTDDSSSSRDRFGSTMDSETFGGVPLHEALHPMAVRLFRRLSHALRSQSKDDDPFADVGTEEGQEDGSGGVGQVCLTSDEHAVLIQQASRMASGVEGAEEYDEDEDEEKQESEAAKLLAAMGRRKSRPRKSKSKAKPARAAALPGLGRQGAAAEVGRRRTSLLLESSWGEGVMFAAAGTGDLDQALLSSSRSSTARGLSDGRSCTRSQLLSVLTWLCAKATLECEAAHERRLHPVQQAFPGGMKLNLPALPPLGKLPSKQGSTNLPGQRSSSKQAQASTTALLHDASAVWSVSSSSAYSSASRQPLSARLHTACRMADSNHRQIRMHHHQLEHLGTELRTTLADVPEPAVA
mmetsp:Transcript_31909/g.67860  ORF Transcript_31909/g.67860 Transcript_31909/m.67860 type:complete len:672 (+) Transcript_31909:99-2114(+)